jgi:hypothetical protein
MNAYGTWAKRGVWLTLAAVLTIGCSPLQTIAFIFHRDKPVPAMYPLRPKEGPKKDLDEELTILILCGTSGGVPQEFATMDRDLVSLLAKRLPEAAKENKDKLTVIPPSKVDKFKIANPTWKSMHPAEIGKKLGADCVLDITLSNIQVYQPNSVREIYEGKVDVSVDQYDVSKWPGEREPAQKYVEQHLYPRTGMIAVINLPLSQFKQRYLEKLAQFLVQKHVDSKPGDFIASEE